MIVQELLLKWGICMRYKKSISAMMLIIMTAIMLSGCVVKQANVTITLSSGSLGSNEKIYLRYADGTTVDSGSQTGPAFTFNTDPNKYINGAYISDGSINWVPSSYSYNWLINGFTTSVDLAGSKPKPAKPAAFAVLDRIQPESQFPGYARVTFAVYDDQNNPAQDGTSIFAHVDPSVKQVFFIDQDTEATSANGFFEEGMSAYTTDGSVNFLLSLSDMSQYETIPLRLYSGSTNNQLSDSNLLYDSQNSVITLTGIGLSAGTLNPAFDPKQTEYTASVPYSADKLTVTASTYLNTIEINGEASLQAGQAFKTIDLNPGDNTITLKASLKPGTGGFAKTYTVIVNRDSGSNAELSGLSLSHGSLSPAFAADVESYTADVDFSVSNLKITATAKDSGATITVAGQPAYSGQASSDISLNDGENQIPVIVTSANGTTKTYAVAITRKQEPKSGNADLSGLSLSHGSLSPAFSADVESYTAVVGSSVDSISITAATADTDATLTIDGHAEQGGQPSAGIALHVGANTIPVIVTAPNGTAKSYIVTVSREQEQASNSGGSGNNVSSMPVSSTDGRLTLPVGRDGVVGLEDAIKITIPAGASAKELVLTIDRIKELHNLLAGKEKPVSPVFELLKNFPESFRIPVTLTLSFNPAQLGTGQAAAVFYYDEAKQTWVKVGGQTNGDKITATVDHFTKFTVLAVDAKTGEPVRQQSEPPIAATVEFRDIAGHWAEVAIKQAAGLGIIKGYEDGTFKPNAVVTRAEFAVMLVNSLHPFSAAASSSSSFTDEASIGAWAQASVAQAAEGGIVKGYSDGSFRPSNLISRLELAVMIARAGGASASDSSSTGFADEENIPAWAKGPIAAVRQAGLMQGMDGNRFMPQGTATRAEAATAILNLLKAKQ